MSFRVKPSWAVIKLTQAEGFLPSRSNRSGEATKRVDNADALTSPFQKARTSSRNLSFHSAQPGGNSPTWYPPGPQSQGSAINLTVFKTGSWVQAFRNPLWLSNPLGSRAKMVPRSNLKPSTFVCSTQYRKLSRTI